MNFRGNDNKYLIIKYKYIFRNVRNWFLPEKSLLKNRLIFSHILRNVIIMRLV